MRHSFFISLFTFVIITSVTKVDIPIPQPPGSGATVTLQQYRVTGCVKDVDAPCLPSELVTVDLNTPQFEGRSVDEAKELIAQALLQKARPVSPRSRSAPSLDLLKGKIEKK